MPRILEIEARLEELRTQLRGEGEVNMDEIENEINALTAERAQLLRRQDLCNRAAANVASGMGLQSMTGAGDTGEPSGGAGAQNRSGEFAEPAEYRDAWAARMMGRTLTEAQERAFDATNAQYRDYMHDTENTAVLIPETVVAGIWKRAEERYALWGDVRKFNVQGTLTMKKFAGIQAGDAAWYDEGTSVADEQNAFAEISLSGCELAKSVSVSWKLRTMAISDFIPFIEREIGERIAVALGNAAYSGKGKPGNTDTFKPEPRGVKTALLAETNTPQVVSYGAGALTDALLRTGIAKLHSSYIPRAVVYVNNNTAWTVLAEIKDGDDKPIFLHDQISEGAVGRMFGMQVKVDAAIGDGEILIGDAESGYWANTNRGMTMHTEDHVKPRITDYMGYAIVDGDVYDSKAFVLIMPAATQSGGGTPGGTPSGEGTPT